MDGFHWFYTLSFLVYLLNLSPVAQRWSTAHHASYDNGAEGILEVLGSAGDLAAGVEFWDLGQSCNGGENSLGTFNREHF